MKTKLSLLVAIGYVASATLAGNIAYGSPDNTVVFRSECTTKGTNLDGSTHTCTTATESHTVEDGYVFNRNRIQTRFEAAAGENNECKYWWSDFVEIVQ